MEIMTSSCKNIMYGEQLLSVPHCIFSPSRLQGLSGKFAFTSTSGGEHSLCFKTNTTRWAGGTAPVKLTFALHTGADAVDYEELAKQVCIASLLGTDLDLQSLGSSHSTGGVRSRG
jgi:hypothetical protein